MYDSHTKFLTNINPLVNDIVVFKLDKGVKMTQNITVVSFHLFNRTIITRQNVLKFKLELSQIILLF